MGITKNDYEQLFKEQLRLESEASEACIRRRQVIADRLNELYPILHKHDPIQYPIYDSDFKVDARHYTETRTDTRNGVICIVYYALFRGEWDELEIHIPAALFWGEIDAEESFRIETEKREAIRLAEDEIRRKRNEENERKSYERLKKKYG